MALKLDGHMLIGDAVKEKDNYNRVIVIIENGIILVFILIWDHKVMV